MLSEAYRKHYAEQGGLVNHALVLAGAILHDIGRVAELDPATPQEMTIPGRLLGHLTLGRDLIREAARSIPALPRDTLLLLEHIVTTHLTLPEWGSPRLPALPEVLILHHADDMDAKLEMYARLLRKDSSPGPFTERDPVLNKALLKEREFDRAPAFPAVEEDVAEPRTPVRGSPPN